MSMRKPIVLCKGAERSMIGAFCFFNAGSHVEKITKGDLFVGPVESRGCCDDVKVCRNQLSYQHNEMITVKILMTYLFMKVDGLQMFGQQTITINS